MTQSIRFFTDNEAINKDSLNERIKAIGGCCYSPTAPTNPIPYQLWVDSDASPVTLSIYTPGSGWVVINADVATADAIDTSYLLKSGGTMTGAIAMGTSKITGLGDATAAQDATTKTKVDARPRTIVVPCGTLSASDNKYLSLGLPACTVTDAYLVSELGVASDGTDFWTFQVRNLTASVNLLAAAKSTNGAAITADTQYALGLDQNLTLAAGAVLQFQATKAASAGNLQELAIALKYTIAT